MKFKKKKMLQCITDGHLSRMMQRKQDKLE